MIICGATEVEIYAALEVANTVYGGNLCFRSAPRPISRTHFCWQLPLSVANVKGPGCRCEVVRKHREWRRGTPIRSACWHAYRDYLYAIFERVPKATVHVLGGTYRGVVDFEAKYRLTGGQNMRSYLEAFPFDGMCNCEEFPLIEELSPTVELGVYTLNANRSISEGLKTTGR
jgi:hypothetical protein